MRGCAPNAGVFWSAGESKQKVVACFNDKRGVDRSLSLCHVFLDARFSLSLVSLLREKDARHLHSNGTLSPVIGCRQAKPTLQASGEFGNHSVPERVLGVRCASLVYLQDALSAATPKIGPPQFYTGLECLAVLE